MLSIHSFSAEVTRREHVRGRERTRRVKKGQKKTRKENIHKHLCLRVLNRYHCGGGFMSGGRHALEEAICTQSTLYFSLWQVLSSNYCSSVSVVAQDS